jgi:hypothetical protein
MGLAFPAINILAFLFSTHHGLFENMAVALFQSEK